MQCEKVLTLKTWRMGLFGRRSSSQIKSGGTPQPTRWPLLMRAAAKPGLEVEPVDEAGKAAAAAAAAAAATSTVTAAGTTASADAPRTLGQLGESVATIGGGEDTTIPSPGRSPKKTLPGTGLHDPLHGRQGCPEFTSFHQGVG